MPMPRAPRRGTRTLGDSNGATERALFRMLAHVPGRLVDGAAQDRELVASPSFVVRERVSAGRRPTHLDDRTGRRGLDVDSNSTKGVGLGFTNDSEMHGTCHI